MSDFTPIGKKCDVYFSKNSALYLLTCKRAAAATGDCWVFEDEESGKIHYIQTFERISFDDQNNG